MLKPILLGCVLLMMGGIIIKKIAKARRRRRWPRDTLIVHAVGRGPWAPGLSPFPMKLETYLRMAQLKYAFDDKDGFSTKGKTPWLSYNGDEVPDSHFCIKYLNKKFEIDFNNHLTPQRQAVVWAAERVAEDSLYWAMCSSLVRDHDNDYLARILPYRGLFGIMFRPVFRALIKNQTWSQGTGRHLTGEVRDRAEADLRSLCEILGGAPYYGGDTPCEQDCAIFGMLAQALWHLPDTYYVTMIRETFPSLGAYCERMKTRFWPDWDELITHGFTRPVVARDTYGGQFLNEARSDSGILKDESGSGVRPGVQDGHIESRASARMD